MARRKQDKDDLDEVEDVEEVEEIEEDSPRRPSRGPQPPRISLTIPTDIRRLIRIAAAKADMEVTDWCKVVLVTAANKTMAKLYPEDEEE